ncbi:RNase adapter RapZ [Histidinibacterium aquaticum]|uniref:RNase adapter RapZ n=1 Tax=Histidinibacterium aquaticum TaxID=2613962 RepID=A0A5J5GH70_9RHOB|nr:RNase adapter RapZ [Histidinibacterium aquaticum]KAA9007092.1 RNase adapter RapZ [Histidinibacterium aquaticum]
MTEGPSDGRTQKLVLVTGPSGAGRSTAINALEDLGYEVIDNLPLSLAPRLLDGPPLARPLALGVDVRNRDFGTDALLELIDGLSRRIDLDTQVLYIDADEDSLVRRYSETRRRHPLAPNDPPAKGIAAERDLLVAIRAQADVLIDTSGLGPNDLRSEIESHFATRDSAGMGVSVTSFSYKRGLPRGMDLVFDCRFLRNPHWERELRGLTGRDEAVDAYVAADPRFEDFYTRIRDLVISLLPAYSEAGKTHLSVGFGCTGGQHRSVMVTERLARALAEAGWPVSSRHRELERRTEAGRAASEGKGAPGP